MGKSLREIVKDNMDDELLTYYDKEGQITTRSIDSIISFEGKSDILELAGLSDKDIDSIQDSRMYVSKMAARNLLSTYIDRLTNAANELKKLTRIVDDAQREIVVLESQQIYHSPMFPHNIDFQEGD